VAIAMLYNSRQPNIMPVIICFKYRYKARNASAYQIFKFQHSQVICTAELLVI